MNFCHDLPRSRDAYAPTSVPTNRRLGFFRSSRITYAKSGPPVGRLLAIDEKVLPPSFVMTT